VQPNAESTSYKWELISRPDSDEYRLKLNADGTEVRLVLLRKEWLLFAGDDYSQLLGRGDNTAH
jgi:hypothetical protein